MDELKPFAWKYELAHSISGEGRGANWRWHLTVEKPNVPDWMVRNLTPLYSAAPTVPEGYALVPVVPTEEMVKAAERVYWDTDDDTLNGPTDEQLSCNAITAAIAAAPKVPG